MLSNVESMPGKLNNYYKFDYKNMINDLTAMNREYKALRRRNSKAPATATMIFIVFLMLLVLIAG